MKGLRTLNVVSRDAQQSRAAGAVANLLRTLMFTTP